jgi:PAS domain-containing protein
MARAPSNPDGTVAWIMLQASSETHPANGYMVGTLTDLTEHKRLQEALRESERFASRLSEVSPVGIYRLDPSGRATYVNDRLREICGATLEEALSDGWRKRLADPADPAVRALDAAIAAGRGFGDLIGSARTASSSRSRTTAAASHPRISPISSPRSSRPAAVAAGPASD